MIYKVNSAVVISRTGAFYPSGAEIKLDEHVNQKEADFLMKAKAIEELKPTHNQSPPKKPPVKKPAKKG